MTILVTMGTDAFSGYRRSAAAAYAEDNVVSGRWPQEDALQRARDDFVESLPQGWASPDNFLFEVQDETSDTVVGGMWFACVVNTGIKSALVYDVETNARYRRRGHARKAFAALESTVMSLGLPSIGLHVFGQNPGAQALYRSLGQGVTGINRLKQLPRSAP